MAAPAGFPSLGGQIADFVQAHCAIPDREQAGDPYILTDEMLRFLVEFYAVDSSGRFVYERGAQLVRSQKWGKGPFAAAIICAEAAGPVVFGGWDADGEPVGRPRATPWIEATAVSEDQVGNIWRALIPMIELGDISADIPDTGLTRIHLPGGGRIEPVTSSAISRQGGRVTFVVQDETGLWTKQNRGRLLADTQRRGLAGMGGRFLETTNSWDPAQDSVAQVTAESRDQGVYLDDVDPGTGSIRNRSECMKMLRRVYGDSVAGKVSKVTGARGWVDLDRIHGEILALLDRDAPQAERYFLNRKRAAESAAFRPERVEAIRRDVDVPDGSLVVVGVDGARFVDGLGMVATVVEGPKPSEPPVDHQWPLGIWERPESAPDEYEHPFDEIDGAMIEAFERFDIWRVYVDPQYIEHLLTTWQGRWGATRIIPWYMNRPRQVAWAVRNYTEAIGADLSISRDDLFAQHLKNARRSKLAVYDDQHRQMYTIAKEFPDSKNKMDGAAAGVISWEARGDCIASGKPRARPRSRVPVFS